jgi:hypothetical protein
LLPRFGVVAAILIEAAVAGMIGKITKGQFGEWRNHPATLFFRQFLKDRADALIHAGTEAWLNNEAAFKTEADEARGRIRELMEVEDVSFDTIEAFYREKENVGESS